MERIQRRSCDFLLLDKGISVFCARTYGGPPYTTESEKRKCNQPAHWVTHCTCPLPSQHQYGHRANQSKTNLTDQQLLTFHSEATISIPLVICSLMGAESPSLPLTRFQESLFSTWRSRNFRNI